MQIEISSQGEFDAIEARFPYSKYIEFRESYRFNERCRLKLTGLNIDVAFKNDGTERKEIMAGMETGLTVGLMNGKAKTISKGAKDDYDIFMALKQSYVELVPPRAR